MKNNYQQWVDMLEQASSFELFRLKIIISNELENPKRIQQLRQQFAAGDRVRWFDSDKNKIEDAIVLSKRKKRISVKNDSDGKVWNISYYMLDLDQKDTAVPTGKHQTLGKNQFHVEETVGFEHDGVSYHGSIVRLNQKTATVMTTTNQKWRVGYGSLVKIIDGSLGEEQKILKRLVFDA